MSRHCTADCGCDETVARIAAMLPRAKLLRRQEAEAQRVPCLCLAGHYAEAVPGTACPRWEGPELLPCGGTMLKENTAHYAGALLAGVERRRRRRKP